MASCARSGSWAAMASAISRWISMFSSSSVPLMVSTNRWNRSNRGLALFYRDLYGLFSPIIIHATPAAVHPGHGRKSSSCQCNHPHGLAHIQSRPLPAHSLSAPHSLHRKQDDADRRPPGGSHASEDFPQRKSPALCFR